MIFNEINQLVALINCQYIQNKANIQQTNTAYRQWPPGQRLPTTELTRFGLVQHLATSIQHRTTSIQHHTTCVQTRTK